MVRFKLMNMLSKKCELSNMWDMYLCPKIHKMIEQIVEDNRFLRVSRSNLDTYEVVDNHNSIAIMQTNTNVHCYAETSLSNGISVCMLTQYT